MRKVLVVDDEPAIATLLEYNLKQADYEVDVATDGLMAFNMGSKNAYDVILLDLMLPEIDGIEVTKRLRQEKIKTPIIIVTAKGDEFDKVLGLEIGADDYVTKPFSPREVLARIKAVMRRYDDVQTSATTEDASDSLDFGRIVINKDAKQVTLDGEDANLTPKEYELLLFLVERKNRVLSRDEILSGVWGYDYAGETRMVDIHVSHLRDKVEVDPKSPQVLKTVRGFGYQFIVEKGK
ncbi:response regulator transcription factor [Periweissella cryptocerci]|uniref:Response regulator transcription factor n=1 Tax=Periweissella cryptocerci TaxID=2506420 RepID=A0A4P6YTD4_9LACO|nr:response regulator transcription factor [Periweissella cryptocerci]QBO35907.1 response regulator transcription factor [Periweissella cryptocerci]